MRTQASVWGLKLLVYIVVCCGERRPTSLLCMKVCDQVCIEVRSMCGCGCGCGWVGGCVSVSVNIYTYMYLYVHIYIHTHTHKHTYVHTYLIFFKSSLWYQVTHSKTILLFYFYLWIPVTRRLSSLQKPNTRSTPAAPSESVFVRLYQ